MAEQICRAKLVDWRHFENCAMARNVYLKQKLQSFWLAVFNINAIIS